MTSRFIPQKYFKNHKMISVGIATACMNRELNLVKAIPSWLKSGADKIHILDWNSDINLREFIEDKLGKNEKVKFFRVNKKKKWVLTHSFNLALSSLDTDFIAKFDCDHICQENIFKEIPLKKGYFYRFNFKDNKIGTNGAFISDRKILEEVNFFDERIISYGWDESDLFDRIQEFTKSIIFLDSKFIDHLPHTTKSRTEDQNLRLEEKIANYLEINLHEFNTKSNFFKNTLSKKWTRNSEGGFILKNKENSWKNQDFSQKEYFSSDVINLSLLLTIEFYQNNYSRNFDKKISSLEIFREIIQEIVSEDLLVSFSKQWELVNAIKSISESNKPLNRDFIHNKLKTIFIKSSITQDVKDDRIEFVDNLYKYLICD